jgi:DNA-binding NarL/FixJ family response regulator
MNDVVELTCELVAAPATTGATAQDVVHLLHVEDNPADAMLMQEYIRGTIPSVVFDTATRISEVTAERVAAADCVLLDLSLPDSTGLEALHALRALSEDLPVIVLTGFDDLELGLHAVRDGADDYLMKSHVDGYTLERAIQYSIERRRLMLQLAQSTAETLIATATSIAADAAADMALEQVRTSSNGRGNEAEVEPRVAVGTHEVAVRVDRETSEYVLSCTSCDWQSDLGSDTLHSWKERGLELTLVKHVDFGGQGSGVAAAAQTVQAAVVQRRSVLRPRGWLR